MTAEGPRQLSPEVRLVPVTEANEAAVLALELDPAQVDFVASNAESLEEAAADPDARPRAIMAQGRVVGFLLYDATSMDGEARIYRMMIDRGHQGKGYGRGALHEALREIQRLGHVRRISICYEPENARARRLYLAAGFQEEGLDEDGQMIAVLPLPRPRQR